MDMTTPQAPSNRAPGPGLADGIRIAKDNEKTAADFYAKAAKIAGNPGAKKLFDQLTEFEKIHYERLTALEESLKEKGAFIAYAGTDFKLPPNLVIKMPELPDRPSVMNIFTQAADLETRAENGYNALAELTTDSQGHDMFLKLAEEEHKHYRILKDVYWTLNNLGQWKGPTR
jgi:rubrerythrin